MDTLLGITAVKAEGICVGGRYISVMRLEKRKRAVLPTKQYEENSYGKHY